MKSQYSGVGHMEHYGKMPKVKKGAGKGPAHTGRISHSAHQHIKGGAHDKMADPAHHTHNAACGMPLGLTPDMDEYGTPGSDHHLGDNEAENEAE